MTVPGEFCWPPMGSFAWPPSLGMCADPITGQALGRQPNRDAPLPGKAGSGADCRHPGHPHRHRTRRGEGPHRGRGTGQGRDLPYARRRVRPDLLAVASRCPRPGRWPTGTPRHRSTPAIAAPSRSCSPTPSARCSTRVRAPTAWSKKTSKESWRRPSPTGIRGPGTPSSTTTWWWPTAPARSPTASGGRSIRRGLFKSVVALSELHQGVLSDLLTEGVGVGLGRPDPPPLRAAALRGGRGAPRPSWPNSLSARWPSRSARTLWWSSSPRLEVANRRTPRCSIYAAGPRSRPGRPKNIAAWPR